MMRGGPRAALGKCALSPSPSFAVLPPPTRGALLSCWGLPPPTPPPQAGPAGLPCEPGRAVPGSPLGRAAASPLHGSARLTHAGGRSGALRSLVSSLGALRGAACSEVVCEARPWAAYFSHLVSRDTAQPAGSPSGSCRGTWEGGRHLHSVGVCLALPGPGEEGDQPPGGEGAEGAEQENPRGQPPGAAEGGVALGLSPRGPEPFPREGLKVRGDLIGLHRKSRGTDWLQAQLDPGLWAVPPASCLPPPLRSADPWALLSDTSFMGTRGTLAAAGSCVSHRRTLPLS